MILSIKNEEDAFLIRLDLMLSMSLWKEFQLKEILNVLFIKHLINLILFKNDVKLLKFRRRLVYVHLWYVWRVRFWLLIHEMNTSRKAMEWLICFSILSLMLGCLLFKKSKIVNVSCSLPKKARMSSTYLK